MDTLLRNKKNKLVSESSMVHQKIELLSTEADPRGIIFGDRILQIIGNYAKKVAGSHAETFCDHIGIDFVRFYLPAKHGDILTCNVSVNRTWNSILEVGAEVTAEDFRTLNKKKILSAYFVFQAVDENKNPRAVKNISPITEEEKRRYLEAEKRYHFRKSKS